MPKWAAAQSADARHRRGNGGRTTCGGRAGHVRCKKGYGLNIGTCSRGRRWLGYECLPWVQETSARSAADGPWLHEFRWACAVEILAGCPLHWERISHRRFPLMHRHEAIFSPGKQQVFEIKDQVAENDIGRAECLKKKHFYLFFLCLG